MLGNSQAMALTCTTTSGGKSPGATGAGEFLQPLEAFFEKSLSPHADHLTAGIQTLGDLVIGPALGRKQDHLGPDDLKIR